MSGEQQRTVLDVAAEAARRAWDDNLRENEIETWQAVAEAVADVIDETGTLGDCGCAGSVTGALRGTPWREYGDGK